MLVQFTVGNFLSFNRQRTISLKAKGIAELKENVSSFAPEKLLRSMVIYGANSSGKSNLIKALEEFKEYFGEERLVSVSRELTKLHEENFRGNLTEVINHFNSKTVKGEIVIVLQGKPE